MTPHPSQEYIITEQTVLMLEQECFRSGGNIAPDKDNCENCPYEPKSGPRKGCCNFDKWEVLKIIRSRPHTSAPGEAAIRASVLDRVEKAVQQEVEDIETDEGDIVRMVHQGELLAIIEALRRAGGEQG